MRRPELRPDNSGFSPHFLPNPNRRGIHIKQSQLFATLTAKTIDADCGQKLYLPRPEQIGSNAYGRRIFYALDVFSGLRNALIVHLRPGMFRNQMAQQIVRRRTGVTLRNAHSGSRKESR